MLTGLSIDITDHVTGILDELGERLDDRTLLNEKIGGDVLVLVQNHLTAISNDRHATAERLGADPSGFWENAADQSFASAMAEFAAITINHRGIGRAMHEVKIEPGEGKQYLTLPLLAAAYNQRAAGLEGLFVLRSKEGALFLARHEDQDKESGLEVLYLLVKSVTLPQDRTLLPPDEAFLAVAVLAAREFFDAIFMQRGGSLS